MKNLISIMGEINRIKELDRIQELPEAKYVYVTISSKHYWRCTKRI